MTDRKLHISELKRIYEAEQYEAEKRINRVTLPIILFYLAFSLLLPFLTGAEILNPRVISELSGILFFLIYHITIFFLLRHNRIHWSFKYITMFVTVSIISIILIGYSFSEDFVHSSRSVTVTTFILAIILSGQYQNPKVNIYTAVLVSLEYTFHILYALLSGFPVYALEESFQRNILTWDVVIANLTFFLIAGLLMFINSRRHFHLILELRESWEKLFIEQKRATFLENFDELTKLHNFKSFQEKLDRQIVIAESRQQNFTLLCLGIDSFKSVNQLYGVTGGNQLLKEIGSRLKAAYRNDDYVCRFMGDKFFILFPDIKSNQNISRLIEKTRNAFKEIYEYDHNHIKITASGGFCSYPFDGDITEVLIEKAETAMYEAKESGKNSFRLFNKDKQLELEQKILIEKAMEEALDNEEFSVVYQPKVNPEGIIQGMELLIRWENPELGRVSPETFIPIAEKSGYIIRIGYFVLRQCCRQIRRWTELGLRSRRITVNVSPFQFLHKGFTQKVSEIMDEYDINPAWLGIELTESSMMIGEEECIYRLNELKKLGLAISIDDFGKGYSSLSRLGNYPVDTLKIDKSFVDGLPESNTSVCLVRSIIDLASNLGYHVIAEGVENKEQIDFLLNHGCTLFQGYYYYKPLPAEEVEPFLIKEE